MKQTTLPPDHFVQMDKVQLLNIEIAVDEAMSRIDDPAEMRAFLMHQAVQSMAVEILRQGYFTMTEGELNEQTGERLFTYSVHVIVDEAERTSLDAQVQARVSAARSEERERCAGVLRATAQAYLDLGSSHGTGHGYGPHHASREAHALNAAADLLE